MFQMMGIKLTAALLGLSLSATRVRSNEYRIDGLPGARTVVTKDCTVTAAGIRVKVEVGPSKSWIHFPGEGATCEVLRSARPVITVDHTPIPVRTAIRLVP